MHKSFSDKKPVVFLHLPKCAGSTFLGILLKQFGRRSILVLGFRKNGLTPPEYLQFVKDELESIPYDRLLHYDVIEGHLYYDDLHELQRNCSLVTMLRDPVRRVISEYHFVKTSRSHIYHKPINERKMTLDQYVRSDMVIPNLQTELLGGDHGRRSTDDALRLAKQRLEHEMAWFGLSEQFDESLVLLRATLQWSKLSYVPYNKKRGKRSEISAELQAEIEAQNAVDHELYEFAKTLFRQRFEALDQQWADDQLQRLRRTNRLLSFLPRIPGAKSPFGRGVTFNTGMPK